ncbi:MAG: hypothetical protein ACOY0T_11995 [Myxococcota bacterium]
MLRLNTSENTTLTLRTAAVALLLLNCSASAEPPAGQGGSNNGNKGGSSNSGGTNSGSGGSSTSNGGTTTGNGGATGMGGSTTSMGGSQAKGGSSNGGSSNGGSTSSNGGSTSANGGTTTGSGGTTTGSGGTATGSGGAANCATYNGTVAKDSTIFKDGFGTSKMGTPAWSGYAYVYTYGTGVTVNPAPMTGCFKGAQVCAKGSIPAADSAGAGIGWNIAQTSGSSTVGTVALTGSVKITFAGGQAGMRVSLGPASGDDYCYTLTTAEVNAGTATIPVASFKQACWDTAKAVAYSGAMIKSIQLMVPGAMAAAANFDYCIVDVEPG